MLLTCDSNTRPRKDFLDSYGTCNATTVEIARANHLLAGKRVNPKSQLVIVITTRNNSEY